MKIDALLTPYFPEKENQFNDSIVIMIDVLRASTSVCAALFNGAKEIIPTETLDKAVQIYSSLSKEMRFLAGERHGLKPNGFDAGNSPLEFKKESIAGKTVIMTTTNGTQIFQKAKLAKARLIGCFANLDSIVVHLNKFIANSESNLNNIFFLCAGSEAKLSYEDTLCVGAFIHQLCIDGSEFEMTDSAHAAKNLFTLHSADLKEFLKTREHAVYLQKIGFEQDLDAAFTYNLYPVVPAISGNSIKKIEG